MFLSSRTVTITKNKANNILCFDVPIVPGCMVCARCSSELSEILNGKTIDRWPLKKKPLKNFHHLLTKYLPASTGRTQSTGAATHLTEISYFSVTTAKMERGHYRPSITCTYCTSDWHNWHNCQVANKAGEVTTFL